MHIIGLTGGIGSGKSLASEIFQSLGVPIIDLDKINKKIIKRYSVGYEEIVSKFGSYYLDKSMDIDKKKLQSDMFTKPECKKRVEEILHPLIYKEFLSQTKEITNAQYIVVVVPLLFETIKYQKIINESLLIDCPEDLQLERLTFRDGISDELAREIIKAQMTRNEKIKKANVIIENQGSKNTLKNSIVYYHETKLRQLDETLI
jgi:dephospho-CoA kinase